MNIVFGYLDPGTGTLIVSAIVGAFAAITLLVRRFWYGAKRLVTRSHTTSVEGDTAIKDPSRT